MDNKYPTVEKTFVMMKPDAIARGIVGRIFQRFEEMGMKLVAGRMIKATKEQAYKHYPYTKKWLIGIGEKSVKAYDGDKKLLKKDYGTDDCEEIGRIVHKKLVTYLKSTPIIITVWEGNHAVERVRKLVGYAVPTFAEVGSIRERFGFDTQPLAVKSGRICFQNIVHASDSVKEAKREIEIWFGSKYKDLSDYERIDYIDIY